MNTSNPCIFMRSKPLWILPFQLWINESFSTLLTFLPTGLSGRQKIRERNVEQPDLMHSKSTSNKFYVTRTYAVDSISTACGQIS
jgi:hypothetical protein